MNISPRTGRVTLTKMDLQTVDRFGALADAMTHHLSNSNHESDRKIGKAAFAASVHAKILSMVISGVEMPDVRIEAPVTASQDSAVDAPADPAAEAAAVEQVYEPTVESAPKPRTKKS